MHIFLTVIFKDKARLAWYDFCLCFECKSNVRYRCLFQTLLLIFFWKIKVKEKKQRWGTLCGFFFRRNYMYIIWVLKKIVSIGTFIEEIQSNIDTVLPVYILVDTIKTNFKNFTRFRWHEKRWLSSSKTVQMVR